MALAAKDHAQQRIIRNNVSFATIESLKPIGGGVGFCPFASNASISDTMLSGKKAESISLKMMGGMTPEASYTPIRPIW